MSTQIQPTPIVTGKAAEKIKEQLKVRPSEQTKKGMEILGKMFENESCGGKVAVCQWCFEKPPVKDGAYCQECLDAARQEEDKQFDLEKWLEEI